MFLIKLSENEIHVVNRGKSVIENNNVLLLFAQMIHTISEKLAHWTEYVRCVSKQHSNLKSRTDIISFVQIIDYVME